MPTEPTSADRAWADFDALIQNAATDSPWASADGEVLYEPLYALLERLLEVPLRHRCTTQSGMPAKAVDVWVAHELRRAGFGFDEVWPRPTTPRVMPREVGMLRTASGVTNQVARQLFERIDAGRVTGVTPSDAKVLGKAYEKQVDVVIAQWSRGPELMISTKRMDSSFGKNALNRIEESYGDAKNLRGRHPLAATGFLFVMRSTAFEQEYDTALRLLDLLAKLAQEPDAYDATGLIVTEWIDPATSEETSADEPQQAPRDVVVALRHDLVPPALDTARFLHRIVECVLDRTPVDLHKMARLTRGQPVPTLSDEAEDG